MFYGGKLVRDEESEFTPEKRNVVIYDGYDDYILRVEQLSVVRQVCVVCAVSYRLRSCNRYF
jgi:hypothetical protein